MRSMSDETLSSPPPSLPMPMAISCCAQPSAAPTGSPWLSASSPRVQATAASQREFRQLRHRAADLGQRRPAREVAHERVQEHAPAQDAQRRGQRIGIIAARRRARSRGSRPRRTAGRRCPRRNSREPGLGGQRAGGVAAERQGEGEVHGGRLLVARRAVADRTDAGPTRRPVGVVRLQFASRPPIMPVGRDLHSGSVLVSPRAARILRLLGAAAVAAFSLFCVAAAGHPLVVFPRIDDYRERIVATLSAELGQPRGDRRHRDRLGRLESAAVDRRTCRSATASIRLPSRWSTCHASISSCRGRRCRSWTCA